MENEIFLSLQTRTNKMNNILAFDCTSSLLSVILESDKKRYINIRDVGLKHSEKLMPLIKDICNEANIMPSMLDLIICPMGPGSFTGLRIAMASAKGLSLALNKPMVCVPTTSYIAAKAPKDFLVVPLIDAKKQRYYCCLFYNQFPLTQPLDISLNNLLPIMKEKANQQNCNNFFLTGEDADKALNEMINIIKTYPNDQQEDYKTLAFHLDPRHKESPIERLLELGILQYEKEGATSLETGPLYIRKSEAEENTKTYKENLATSL